MTAVRIKIINQLMKEDSLTASQLSSKTGLKMVDIANELLYMKEVERISQNGIVILRLADSYQLPMR